MAKYDSSGTLILLKDGWGDSDAVDTDRFGNIYLAGRSRLGNIANSRFLTSAGGDDAWVARFTRRGIGLVRNFGGANNDGINDLKIDGNDRLIVVGDFRETMTVGGVLLSSGGAANVNISPFVLQLNPADGDPVRVGQGLGDNSATPSSLAIHPDGSYRVAGQFRNSVTFGGITLTNSGFGGGGGGGFFNVAGFEMVFNSSGIPVSGTLIQDNLAAVVTPDPENIYLYGSYNGTETNLGQTMTAAGGDDAFLIKRSGSGEVKYVREISSIGDDLPAVGDGISVDRVGNVHLAGHIALTNGGNVRFNDLTFLPPSTRSAFLAKISSEIAIRREPVDQVATNLNVVFRALPTGEHPFNYQWFFNGTTPIPGERMHFCHC